MRIARNELSPPARLTRGLAAVLVAAAATAAVAQDAGAAARRRRPSRKAVPFVEPASVADKGALRLLPPDSSPAATIETASGPVDYTATAGTLSLLRHSRASASAAVFYTAYIVDTATAARRPVTFVFNGGPGAASAYLHLGLVGPRIAEFGAERPRRPATRLHDNPHTWLQFTDLVMIDPVGSGFSRPAKADGGGAFWGVARDADAMAKVIALWLANNRRADSPKFILGESYGGFRAAKVATRAAQRSGHRRVAAS